MSARRCGRARAESQSANVLAGRCRSSWQHSNRAAAVFGLRLYRGAAVCPRGRQPLSDRQTVPPSESEITVAAQTASRDGAKKNPPREYRGGFRNPCKPGSGVSAGEERALRENDLDAPVLRLAHTERRRNPRIVHAATGDDHVVARHAHAFEGDRHGVCAPL
jgi:hypothetical protein